MDANNEKVVMLGIGGGGGKIVHATAKTYAASWMDLVYLDTDVEELDYDEGVLHLPLGRDWTHGSGCGGDPLVGKHATGASANEIRELVRGAKLAVIVACLGGGAGSGGAQVLASLAREEHTMCLVIATLPFSLEGNRRREVAEQSLRMLHQDTDMLAPVPNDLLFEFFPADSPVAAAFAVANEIIAGVAAGIAGLTRGQHLLPVDFASLRALLKPQGITCSVGIGRAVGADKNVCVVENLLESPLLGGVGFIQDADVVVGALVGGTSLSLGQMQECLSALQERLGAKPKTLFGANVVDALGDDLQLTLLTIQYSSQTPSASPGPTPEQRPQPDNRPPADTRQISLPFAENSYSLGIFAGASPTERGAENLDIPTFQRQGVRLEDPE